MLFLLPFPCFINVQRAAELLSLSLRHKSYLLNLDLLSAGLPCFWQLEGRPTPLLVPRVAVAVAAVASKICLGSANLSQVRLFAWTLKRLRLVGVEIFGSAGSNPRFLARIWVILAPILGSWLLDQSLHSGSCWNQKGKSSVLAASSLWRFEVAFGFVLTVLLFLVILQRFAVCVDQGDGRSWAAADVGICGGIAVRGPEICSWFWF